MDALSAFLYPPSLMSSTTFNLTLPVYPNGMPGRRSWMSEEQRITHDAIAKARVTVLIGLLQAISPELAAITPATGGCMELFTFRFSPSYHPSLAVKEMETGQIELRMENGYRHNKTFRRISVDPKTGAIDPRIVEVTRELVTKALAIVVNEAASKVRAATEAEQKAADFAHAATVVKVAGLSWAYGEPRNNEADVHMDGYSRRVRIVGRRMKVELTDIDVDRLPALVAFVRSLNGGQP